MVLVRKRKAGSDSLGHVWAHDGDTVEMPYVLAAELLAIRDAGFEIIEPDREEFSESPPPAPRRGRPSKTAEVAETT